MIFELGALVRRYGRSRKQARLVGAITLVFCAVSGLVFFGAASSPPAWGQAIGLSILASFLALPAILGARELLRARGAALELYENGFVLRKQGRESSATWDEIASVIAANAIRIDKKNGEVIEFGAVIEGWVEVGQRIEEQTQARLLTEIEQALDAGQSHEFKALSVGTVLDKNLLSPGFTVDADGIADLASGQRIAWTEIESFGIGASNDRRLQGFPILVIRSKERSFQALYAMIQNGALLLALCAERAPGASNVGDPAEVEPDAGPG